MKLDDEPSVNSAGSSTSLQPISSSPAIIAASSNSNSQAYNNTNNNNNAVFKWSHYYRSFIALFLFTYNSAVQASLTVMNCVSVSFQGKIVHVIQDFPAISCDTNHYRAIFGVSMLVLIIYAIVMPAIVVILLLHPRTSSKFPNMFDAVKRVVTSPFERDDDTNSVTTTVRHLWEVWRLVIKGLLLIVVVFETDLSK